MVVKFRLISRLKPRLEYFWNKVRMTFRFKSMSRVRA